MCVEEGVFSCFSRVQLFVIPWTVALQAPPSMEYSRQEYWSGWPFPSPSHLPNPGIEFVCPELAGRFFTTKPPGRPLQVTVQQWTNEHKTHRHMYVSF